MKLKFLLPLLGFFVLAGFLFVGLSLNPRDLPSPLIGKPVPAFNLPVLGNANELRSHETFKGKVWMFNVWASWCVSCKAEHPVFVELAKRGALKMMVGLNQKDKRPAAQKWLSELGDPYAFSIVDADGRTSIDFGVTGVPETFVIDKRNVIRYRHVGPVTMDAWARTIKPLLDRLEAE